MSQNNINNSVDYAALRAAVEREINEFESRVIATQMRIRRLKREGYDPPAGYKGPSGGSFVCQRRRRRSR